jgi:oxalate decarboxylase/phosphoglucose isomerase-like protein (cupin superfamily)
MIIRSSSREHASTRRQDGQEHDLRIAAAARRPQCVRAGQEHALHAHAGQDKVYQVIEGEGVFLLEGRELPMQAGRSAVAPEGVAHGVRNTARSPAVLAILAPAPHQ